METAEECRTLAIDIGGSGFVLIVSVASAFGDAVSSFSSTTRNVWVSCDDSSTDVIHDL